MAKVDQALSILWTGKAENNGCSSASDVCEGAGQSYCGRVLCPFQRVEISEIEKVLGNYQSVSLWRTLRKIMDQSLQTVSHSILLEKLPRLGQEHSLLG